MWLVSGDKLSDNRLSDNKLSDNNLASELVWNRSFFKPITIEEIVIFMIMMVKSLCLREGFLFSLFSLLVKLIHWPWGGT